ncbi:MAG: hypothetical protein IKR19_08590 [Acholeplasmatales bacterium]|nr:hypothetical protein [Acholeplasmatales bacterium]
MANANKLFNNYTITPRNLTQYTAYRGVTDFTQIGQFNQYETGYQFLEVISLPKFLEVDPTMTQMNKNFKHMLEFEFRGMDGLADLNADTYTITDGINEMQMINRVSWDTSIEVSMEYFEKSGSLITKYSEYYLTGIKDPKTQAKTYHGLIADGTIAPGLENEVFTLLYYVTDNTMLRLERAILLANCQLRNAQLSMYNGNRESINNKPMTITFSAFPVIGYEVDKAANYLLQQITGVRVENQDGVIKYNGPLSVPGVSKYDAAVLDSSSYRYGIMGGNAYGDGRPDPQTIPRLASAIENGTM